MSELCRTTCAQYDMCARIGGGDGESVLLGVTPIGNFAPGQRETARILAGLAAKCNPDEGCAIVAGAGVMQAINWGPSTGSGS